jgi:hypothetical protein
MAGPRHAEDRWLWPAIAVAMAIAIGAAAALYVTSTRARSFRSMSESAREELARVDIPVRAAAAVEREWFADFGQPEYLVAPVGPLPCEGIAPYDRGNPEALAPVLDANPDDLLVALAFGTELVRAGRHAEASRVMGQTLDRTRDDNRIIENARDPQSLLDLNDTGVSTVIHLHHARGVAQLMTSGGGAPWDSLKNVIGSVKVLSRRRLLGSMRGDPTWSRLPIVAPGCTAVGPETLTSYDLYNNLIVAYMRGGYAAPDETTRRREFTRDRKTYPSPVHRLLLIQYDRARANGWKDESQLWALSNVEQVLDWRRPDDARLNVNAIRVVDWWLEEPRCPSDVCTDALKTEWAAQKAVLLEQALLRRNVTADQQRAFAQTATRLLAESPVDRTRVADAMATLRGWLAQGEASTVADLAAADAARRTLGRDLVGLSEDADEPEAKLGRRGDAWRNAAEIDFTAAAGGWARRRSPAEQDAVIVASRQLLGAREAPPELLALEGQRGAFQRFALRVKASQAWWAFWSVVLFAAIAFALLFVIFAVRDRRLLRTSFYNVELEHQRGAAPPPSKRSVR